MRYRRKPMVVDAIVCAADMNFQGKNALAGDYLVSYSDGSMGVIKKAVFEAHFEPDSVLPILAPSVVSPLPAPVTEEITGPPQFVCLGCGAEVNEELFEKKSGMCVECLKQTVKCHTCGADVKQWEVLGTVCLKCLKKA